LSDDEISDIGLNANVYLYLLVTMEVTRRQMTNNHRARSRAMAGAIVQSRSL
jgi:hypothetical protein